VAKPLLEQHPLDRQAQAVQASEVRLHPYAGKVLLREVDFLLRAIEGSPAAYMPLEGPQLPFVVRPAMLLTQPLEQRLGLQFRRLPQHRLGFRPVRLKWILTCPPVPCYDLLRGQLPAANVVGRRVAVHPRFQRRHLNLPALLILHE